jgi:GT2 family glycosyltransferase
VSLIEVVAATRLTPTAFARAPLAVSLSRIAADPRLSTHIAFQNRRGLPEIYNRRILNASADVLWFVHDDVWIDQPDPVDAVLRGLSRFDIIGVAGNRRIPPAHVGWAFVDDDLTWDDARHLSGEVAHGRSPHGAISHYGRVPSACELLDGVSLAVRRRAVKRKRVLFDPAFAFHFYDLDFCRTARRHGLRLGTWSIAITHRSGGGFGSPAWKKSLRAYKGKWAPARRR